MFRNAQQQSLNRIELDTGTFTSKLYGSRVDYGFSPRMFASALLQYSSNDRLFSTNLRFRWEYRPGSEMFVVYTDDYNTEELRPDVTALRNRALVIKVNRLFRL